MNTLAIRICLVLCLSATLFCGQVLAYEEETHLEMTRSALGASQARLNLWRKLGLPGTFETSQFRASHGTLKTAEQLMGEGVMEEDGWVEFIRSQNHFYNPRNAQGYSWLIFTGEPAPDWALEDIRNLSGISAQAFSYRDARQAFFRALTMASPEERSEAFGLMFTSLGHVLHPLQDMAQPQHTRNDNHFVLTHPSLYEHHAGEVKANYMGIPYPRIVVGSGVDSLVTPRSFFHSQGTNGVAEGKGLAEFSHRNFVTAGTNFRGTLQSPAPAPDFPLPTAGPTAVYAASEVGANLPFDAHIHFVSTSVTDTLNPASSGVNLRASTHSIFDDDLKAKGGAPKFAYNTLNIESALAFLIPRAISYSTGMVDYFFRGEIDLAADDANMGKYVILNYTTEPMEGTFELFYDAVDGIRRAVPGGRWPNMTIPARDSTSGTPGRGQPIVVKSPFDSNGTGVYMLVFVGKLGAEGTESNEFGAVVGRKVTAAPLEALYVAGEDTAGRQIVVRVDENGTHLISGPDGTGATKVNEGFRPFPGIVGDSYENKNPTGFKQARLIAGDRYRVVAYRGVLSSGIRGPVGLQSGSGWRAESTDPTIGSFVFELGASLDGSYGSLTFVRTYVDAGGVTRTANGSVALPTLPGFSNTSLGVWAHASPYSQNLPITRRSYADLMTAGPIVGADGQSIHGLMTANTVSTPALPWPSNQSNFSGQQVMTVNSISLRIALAAVPTVTLNVDETFVWTKSISNSASGGEPIQTTFPGCYGGVMGLDGTAEGTERRESNSTTSGRIVIGLFDGVIRDYRYNGNSTGSYFHSHRDFDWYSGTPCDFYRNVDFRDHTEGQAVSTMSFDIGGSGQYGVASGFGSVSDYRYSPIPGVSYHTVCPSTPNTCVTTPIGYDVVASDVPNDPPLNVKDPAIVFAPNSSAVVYYELLSSTATRTLKFRGIDLTNKRFVADSSPLGEMFFALSDGSVVIHEPRNGRMPTFVRPANMVKIKAALWL